MTGSCPESTKGNDELKAPAEKLIDIVIGQLKTLKTKKSDW